MQIRVIRKERKLVSTVAANATMCIMQAQANAANATVTLAPKEQTLPSSKSLDSQGFCKFELQSTCCNCCDKTVLTV